MSPKYTVFHRMRGTADDQTLEREWRMVDEWYTE
jgi:hypothetical protein